MWEYRATVTRIVDGDTYDLDVDLGFHLRQVMRLRLLGVNTPEIIGQERELGLAAKAFVESVMPAGSLIRIRTYKTDSFGRYLADVFLPDDRSLAALLIETDHAVAFP